MRSWDTTESRAIQFWTKKLRISNIVNWINIWTFKLKKVQDNALMNFNFKFMYNILPSPDFFLKWVKKENDKCIFCDEAGSLLHMFYYCSILGSFWRYVENTINKYSYNATFVIEPHILIYGFDFSKENLIDLAINYALLSIYRTLLMFHQKGHYTNYTGNEFTIMFKFMIKRRFEI